MFHMITVNKIHHMLNVNKIASLHAPQFLWRHCATEDGRTIKNAKVEITRIAIALS